MMKAKTKHELLIRTEMLVAAILREIDAQEDDIDIKIAALCIATARMTRKLTDAEFEALQAGMMRQHKHFHERWRNE